MKLEFIYNQYTIIINSSQPFTQFQEYDVVHILKENIVGFVYIKHGYNLPEDTKSLSLRNTDDMIEKIDVEEDFIAFLNEALNKAHILRAFD